MVPERDLHLPISDPNGAALRRRFYVATLLVGTGLMLLGAVHQFLVGGHEPFLTYGAPVLVVLGAADLWWLLSGRSLVIAETVGVSVMAVATVLQVVIVSASAQPATFYPNSGPYWGMVCVCALTFLALPARQARPLSLTLLLISLTVPWVLHTPYASANTSGLLRVQLSATTAVLLIWALAWFRGQHESQAETQERLRTLAYTDALTGLPNRRAVYPAVDALLTDAGQGQAGALFLVDLDHFKRINDVHGHGVGDEVLMEVARVIGNAAREENAGPATVGRWGGEEFISVMPGTTGARAHVRAQQLLAEVRAHPWPHDLQLTLSIGGSVARPGEEFTSLLARADQSLYAAKLGGRDRAVIDGAED